MARVEVVFEDKPGGLVIQVQSEPQLRVKDNAPDPDHLTPAIAAAFGAVMEVAGLAATMDVFTLDEPII